MGRSVRSVIRDRIPQAQLNALIQSVQPVVVEREHVEPRPILSSDIEYDTLHPEETIKEFCAAIRNMLARYQYNKEQYDYLEQEMQDILHFIEMGSDKNANTGFKLYKQLAEIRRQRRICKNEMDLLQPIYDAFGGNEKLNVLAQVQGLCRTTKQAIDNRAYTVRTDVLNTFIKPIEGRD